MTKFNYINCLKPLLQVLAWQGDSRRIFEAVPYEGRDIDLIDLKNIFVNLGYTCYDKKVRLSKLSRSFLPTLFINESKGIFWIIYERTDRDFLYIDCRNGEKASISCHKRLGGVRYNFVKDLDPCTSSKSWGRQIWDRFSGNLWLPVVLSFICGILTLSLPWFAQFIIDHLMASPNHNLLIYRIGGMSFAFGSWFILSAIKNRTLSYLIVRITSLMNDNLLRQLLLMSPVEFKELSLRDYLLKLQRSEADAGIISRKLIAAFLDLVPIVGALIMMSIMAGYLVIIPIVAIFASFSLIPLTYRKVSEYVAISKLSAKVSENFCQETIMNCHAIQDLGAARRWIDRYKTYLWDAVLKDQHLNKKLNRLSLFHWINMMMTGIVIGFSCAHHVINGEISQGTLIAIGILTWQIYYPLTNLVNQIKFLPELRDKIFEINRLMKNGLEVKPLSRWENKPVGHLQVNGVNFRYPDRSEMALQNIQMQVKPGEVVAVIGQNASGKSTFVQLLMRMHSPLSGTITLDGIDISQIDPITYRQSIGYAPSIPQFFVGTIAQNLRLVQPEATDSEIFDVLSQVGLTEEIERLDSGIHTELTSDYALIYSSGFLQRLNLARALIRDSNILIFDEPTGSIDIKSDAVFKDTIKNLKGKKTIIIVTHRPSIMNLADQILVLNKGIMRLFGPRDRVLNILSRNAA